MIHSSACQQALRALIYVASEGPRGPILTREIAEAVAAPQQSLSKILHHLRSVGLLRSRKGPGGGYQLTRPARDVRLLEIVEAMDGKLNLMERCILGLDRCDEKYACALHSYWTEFRESYCAGISSMTLEEAAQTWVRRRTDSWGT